MINTYYLSKRNNSGTASNLDDFMISATNLYKEIENQINTK